MTELFRFSVLAMLLITFASVGYTFRTLQAEIADLRVAVNGVEHNVGNRLDEPVECVHYTVKRPD